MCSFRQKLWAGLLEREQEREPQGKASTGILRNLSSSHVSIGLLTPKFLSLLHNWNSEFKSKDLHLERLNVLFQIVTSSYVGQFVHSCARPPPSLPRETLLRISHTEFVAPEAENGLCLDLKKQIAGPRCAQQFPSGTLFAHI